MIRKCAHIVEYFIFSVLLWLSIRTPGEPWRFRWALLAVALATAYAATDEFHQIFVPGRGASVHDVMIDACGATLAQIIIWLWMRRSEKSAA